MRKRLLAGLAGPALVVAAATASGCGGPGASPGNASPGTAAPSTTPTAPSPSFDPLEDCVLSIAPWLRTYLDGGTDLGDYQEMGLSSAQGGALRELQRQAAALGAQGPLPPDWADREVRRACAAIVAARATMTAKPTGWP
ncbi:hypothetical protein [Kitasatospora sp. NPDC002965]|uniref:hypothetical protein n=1 Tax=Kitasatospora sp. NPDC002965 TaxID=3154775 RepID=UPI0033AD8AA7